MLILLFTALFSMANPTTYPIKGMTCNSCVKIITSKVCSLEGLESCKVELGSLTVKTKDGAKITPADLAQAVQSAGKYELVLPAK